MDETGFTRPSIALRMAAVMLHETREPITACEALHRVLPLGAGGQQSWEEAKGWLRDMLPESFECDQGWWRMEDREARLLGVLLAGDMAEWAGD
jgi:hypothetical protein